MIDDYNKALDPKEEPLDIGISIVLNDSINEYKIELDEKDMLIDGKHMDAGDHVCYLPYFIQKQYAKTWILGTLVMHDYYMVFDRTPNEYDKFRYNRVGIAKKNPVDSIGKQEIEEAKHFLWIMIGLTAGIFVVSLSCIVYIIRVCCKINRKDASNSSMY